MPTKINQNDKALQGCGTIIPSALEKLRLFFSIGLSTFSKVLIQSDNVKYVI
ncbi:MAG: hypothetical protein M3232_04010 [Thermoproteota archaeon]|nr:hypothetical protein [Thermoproteota archaeon]